MKRKPDVEIPQKRMIFREEDLNTTVRKAAPALECDINSLINAKRVSGLDKDKRDLLILILWKTGLYRNYEIAKILNISYSSVSK